MSAIKMLKNEQGWALISTLVMMVFLGMLGITLVSIVVADAKMQAINLERPRALYAAQSGVEYAFRGIMEYARSNSSLGGIHNYTETIPAGGGATATITITTIGIDSVEIKSVGHSANFSQTLTKGFSYTDVSDYAVYSTGNVSNVKVFSGGGIKQNAAHMPKFDLDVLRDIARPYRYFTGNLTINSVFTFTSSVAFIEGNLTFSNFNITNFGNFVSGNNITLNTVIILPTYFEGVMYQPNPSQFQALGAYRTYLIKSGIFVNGNVSGVSYFFNIFKNLNVWYNRTLINNFMQHSVNGGPLIVTNSSWRRQH